jgi:hypothetical protein
MIKSCTTTPTRDTNCHVPPPPVMEYRKQTISLSLSLSVPLSLSPTVISGKMCGDENKVRKVKREAN